MALKRKTKPEASFSMSSMTDIVFLLLLFFLITSTLVNPNALKLLLPKSTGQISARPTVSISIKHYPEQNMVSYHINGNSKPIRFDQIEGNVVNLLQGDIHLLIYADGLSPSRSGGTYEHCEAINLR